jgi:hypothetical protein
MGLNLIRWNANERVGLPDQNSMSNLVLEEMIRKNRDLFVPEGLDPVVFGGFELTHSGGPTATLTYGAAVMKLQKDQELQHGFFLGRQNPASYTLDFSGAGDDSYNVYVRAVYTESGQENRVFWNPGTSQEYVDYVSTRRTVTWEVTYVSTGAPSPGEEWMSVWEVVVVSGNISTATDLRNLMFEGDYPSTWAHLWGDGANDRSVDRGIHGVTDLWTWIQAVRRQLGDIIGDTTGSHFWWKVPAIELESLNLDHYSEADSATHKGKHKTGMLVGDASIPGFWQIGAIDTSFSIVAQDANVGIPSFVLSELDADPGEASMIVAPRGALNPLSVGDSLRTYWGSVVDFEERYSKVAADERYKDLYMNSVLVAMFSDGAGVARPGLNIPNGIVTSRDGFRLTSPAQAQSQVIALQWAIDNFTSGWTYTTGGFGSIPGSSGRLYNNTLSQAVCSIEITLPHNATLNAINVIWDQAASTGGAQNTRMYAQRHRAGSTLLGLIGGGTGAPSTFTSLKPVNDYIEHPGAGGGGATPYLYLSMFSCTAAAADRTFDSTQDKLVITFEGHDAGVIAANIYWLWVNFDLDYVTPPLV